MKLFDRWARLLEERPQERVHAGFVQELQAAGFLKVGRWLGGGAVVRWEGAADAGLLAILTAAGCSTF